MFSIFKQARLFIFLPFFKDFYWFVSRGGVLEDTFWSPWPRSLKSSKIALSSARGQHYFWTVEISLENARNLAENLQRPFFLVSSSRDRLKKTFWRPFLPNKIFWRSFFWDRLKKIFGDIFFLENTCVCVLGPWPREGLSLALDSNFFCVLGLGLEPCVLDSTSVCELYFWQIIRGGVLEDIFWSPWPWPRSLKSSKIALSLARGQHYFLNRWNFVGKRQKPCGKFAKTFFCFL